MSISTLVKEDIIGFEIPEETDKLVRMSSRKMKQARTLKRQLEN
jgi:hypothetical protein